LENKQIDDWRERGTGASCSSNIYQVNLSNRKKPKGKTSTDSTEEGIGTTLPTISEYEQMRLSNIERNKRKFEEIFGKNSDHDLGTGVTSCKRKKTKTGNVKV